MTKHTTTPWFSAYSEADDLAWLSSCPDDRSSGLFGDIATFWLGNKKQNAEFATRAVNCHADLLAALKIARARLVGLLENEATSMHFDADRDPTVAAINAAIIKAETP